MKNAKNQNREIFVFIGQNATCGNPHPVTGRMSTYGTIYRIAGTLREAREWADYRDNGYAQTVIAVGGRRKMREFCLGQTMRNFNDTLDYAPVVYANDNENACDWNVG